MRFSGNIEITFSEKELSVLWKTMQYYHEVVNNKGKGMELTGEEEDLRDKMHSALWHACICQNAIIKEREERK
jgi:hypothetical protein